MLKKISLVLLILFFAKRGDANIISGDAESNFKFAVTPYAWLIGMNGTAGAKGHSTKLDTSFSDISSNIDSAGMLELEGLYNNNLGFILNFSMASLGDQESYGGVSLSGKTHLTLGEAALFYRFASVPFGSEKSSLMDLDFLAGVRFWNVGLRLDANVAPFRISYDKKWADPFIGIRAQLHMNEKWRFIFQGSFGGGGDTSGTWDAQAFAAYSIGRNSKLLIGYRALGIDRREGNASDDFIFDLTLHGPVLGVIFNF